MRTLNGKYVVDDPRNDLLLQFMRFVRCLRPKAIMMENVPALANDHRLYKALIDLGRMGYNCSTAILNAAKYAYLNVVALHLVGGESQQQHTVCA